MTHPNKSAIRKEIKTKTPRGADAESRARSCAHTQGKRGIVPGF